MDVVIPYVNGCEHIWLKNYCKYAKANIFSFSQFFDWETLKYVLRGISFNMPYVENVFLLVSNIEQVPSYVNQKRVKVVLHSEFIPEKHLPTFNSSTIEMFLHKIPGLGEEFVYFNDDIIPLLPISKGRFFTNGIPHLKYKMGEDINDYTPYARDLIKSGYTFSNYYIDNIDIDYSNMIVPVHGLNPYKKSDLEDIHKKWEILGDRICTRFRNFFNVNQYLYADVYYLKSNYIESDILFRYIQTNEIFETSINDIFSNCEVVCVNDFGPIGELSMKESKDLLCTALEKKLPYKSIYENRNN